MEFMRQGSDPGHPISTSIVIWLLCPPLALAIRTSRRRYLRSHRRGVRFQDLRPEARLHPALRDPAEAPPPAPRPQTAPA